MRYVKYTSVDAVTATPVTEAPATNGPAEPSVVGLKFVFALESKYPTSAPIYYGTAPNASSLDVAGVLGELTQAEFEADKAAEMADRATIVRNRLLDQIPSERYSREVSGIIWNGVFIDTDGESQPKIQAARAAAKDGLRLEGAAWKCGDPQTGSIIYRATSNAEMIEVADMVFTYVQDCYTRESELMAAVIDGSYTADMIARGWPARV